MLVPPVRVLVQPPQNSTFNNEKSGLPASLHKALSQMADNSWIFVDDRDPGIAYYEPPGATIWQGGVSQEYDQTTTGLDLGDTATYYFNGMIYYA